MDIQYNDGTQAVRYLAKYMAKDDLQHFCFSPKARSTRLSSKISLSQRIRSFEDKNNRCRRSYTYMISSGWHKHSNSRNVVFLNTGLYNYDSLRIRSDFRDSPEESEDIFAKISVFVYEKREGADMLTLPPFFCFYIRESQASEDTEIVIAEGESSVVVNRRFYNQHLPKYVRSGKTKFVLRTRDRVAFWRTFNQNEMNSDSFYYQQVVFKEAIFNTTYQNVKGAHQTWEDYYEHLISIPLEEGGIEPATARSKNVSTINDIILDLDRGARVTKRELKIMLDNANEDQINVYNHIKYELVTNSAVFVSGAAGTGKSYIILRLTGYKVVVCAL